MLPFSCSQYTSAVSAVSSVGLKPLPGGTAASSLLPDYPFLKVGGGQRGGQVSPMPDGGMSAPLAYGSLVMGVLAVWQDPPLVQHTAQIMWRGAWCA